ncbi:MAG: putative ORFan [Satyrvirus sp.]|uniref:Putative ORFan n=1 Tax=Satyrvirus sp. TaxID=2487771 RepID=A0A3G5ADL1_9VIRU|nr:MAG: putative ORFan [Satyrvirus sp.]
MKSNIKNKGKSLIFTDTRICCGCNKSKPSEPNLHLHEVGNLDMSSSASISNINFNYDKNTDTTYVQKLSNNLVVRNDSDKELVEINGNSVSVFGNLNISDDIDANNINLLGDLVATNIICTTDLKVNKNFSSANGYLSNNLKIGGILNSNHASISNMQSENIQSENVSTDILQTLDIISPSNLNLMVPFNHTITVPNIKYGVTVMESPLIDPVAIKLFKVFVVSTNVLVNADSTCDGIEIIIYNRNPTCDVIIRDHKCIITKLCGSNSTKMVYADAIGRWIVY